MINVDWTLFIQIGNFLILIFILNAVLYRPIRNILQQRKEKISGFEQEIDLFSKKAQEKDLAFSDGIKEARTKGLSEKDKIVQKASHEEKGIIAGINEKAQAELASVKNKIAKDAENIRSTLLRDIDVYASQISQKILGRTA